MQKFMLKIRSSIVTEKFSYDRQYIATKYREVTELSSDFWFACKPNACSNTSAMNAQCLSMRSRTDNNKNVDSLQELIEFRNASWPIFFKAMDRYAYTVLTCESSLSHLDKCQNGILTKNYQKY